jgi:putative SOS response-associated peptidase YedK
MCGRYNITDDEPMRRLMGLLGISGMPAVQLNIAPTETIPVVIRAGDENALVPMHWWLTPAWAPERSTRFSMFNARMESLTSSRAFHGPFRHRRAIVPASSFIEWQRRNGGKMPWCVHGRERALALAAVWDLWEKQNHGWASCAIITRPAIGGLSTLHPRMPAILAPEHFDRWLTPATGESELFDCLGPYLPEDLERFPLDPAANNARIKDRRAVTPQGEAVSLTDTQDMAPPR